MPANHEHNYVLNNTVEEISEVLRTPEFSSRLRIELKSENPTENGVWFRFHHGVSFSSWGEKITITLTPADNNSTNIHISSECGMSKQFIDWGKNKRVVANIFESIEKALNKGASETSQPRTIKEKSASDSSSKAEASSSEREKRFCYKCGAPLLKGASFCSKCGTKQQ